MAPLAIVGWLAASCSLAGIVLSTFKHHWCWRFWIVGTAVWTALAWQRADWPQFTLFAIYEFFNVWGAIKWTREHRREQAATTR
jgi:hypothetical protein